VENQAAAHVGPRRQLAANHRHSCDQNHVDRVLASNPDSSLSNARAHEQGRQALKVAFRLHDYFLLSHCALYSHPLLPYHEYNQLGLLQRVFLSTADHHFAWPAQLVALPAQKNLQAEPALERQHE